MTGQTLFVATSGGFGLTCLATVFTDASAVKELGVIGVLGLVVIVLARYVAAKDVAQRAASQAHHEERERNANLVLSLAREAVSEIAANRERGQAILNAMKDQFEMMREIRDCQRACQRDK